MIFYDLLDRDGIFSCQHPLRQECAVLGPDTELPHVSEVGRECAIQLHVRLKLLKPGADSLPVKRDGVEVKKKQTNKQTKKPIKTK